MSIEEENKYLDAVDLVCLNCCEDTLNHPEVCETCPVRKSVESLEVKE